MRRALRVHVGVEDDLLDAFAYLEDAAPAQVDRLYTLFLDATKNHIYRLPNAYAPLFEHYRHIYLRPFNYYVAYQVTDATIDILAVRHGMEDPDKIRTELTNRTFG